MPPRLRCRKPQFPIPRNFSTTPILPARTASTTTRPTKALDAYLQARRQAYEATLLAQHRHKQMMRPLDFAFWGQDSPFIKSLRDPNAAPNQQPERIASDSIPDGYANPSEKPTSYNYRVPEQRLEEQLNKTRVLTTTVYDPIQSSEIDSLEEGNAAAHELIMQKREELKQIEEQRDKNATEALKRILSTELQNSDDQLKRDIDRCIEVFGRHTTDYSLPVGEKFRVGRDTGSSEVQIAILTVKILNLARAISGKGRHDKSNKRQLQMFIHKRQKLLNYLKRRENGGPRYQNLINQLGLI